ncbi:hypothetical protein CY34DRAFT_801963 [Suillus luteus UH-Slu-Lm8-n1]|uniref:Uncharacterized protein n=1 Tax=Suillus luteus UH-Slu-Lm8-n1 TaxID=930992 RepID=A0A0D0BG90_9AGAM|nr:hypothetical protein CY34DRAFT_801963 [Suillus luteus UH-Slu-Lm8-n1]
MAAIVITKTVDRMFDWIITRYEQRSSISPSTTSTSSMRTIFSVHSFYAITRMRFGSMLRVVCHPGGAGASD